MGVGRAGNPVQEDADAPLSATAASERERVVTRVRDGVRAPLAADDVVVRGEELEPRRRVGVLPGEPLHGLLQGEIVHRVVTDDVDAEPEA
jgi:hypothetical protein